MSDKLETIDSLSGYRHVQAQVDMAVRRGLLEREKAYEVLKNAKKNYQEEKFNRYAEKYNKGCRDEYAN